MNIVVVGSSQQEFISILLIINLVNKILKYETSGQLEMSYVSFLLVICLALVESTPVDLTSESGSDVSFKCPCCGTEPEDCTFKKVFGDIIVNQGVIDEQFTSRFEWDRSKQAVTLKKCTEQDAGVYLWMCKGCAVNLKFKLSVLQAEVLMVSVPLECQIGRPVTFANLSNGLTSCNFQKKMTNETKNILSKGIIQTGFEEKFEYFSNGNAITLKLRKCSMNDVGEYHLDCGESLNVFHLRTEQKQPVHNPNINCHRGENVHFKCPCCPHESKECSLKKVFGENIVTLGAIERRFESKFEWDENNEGITLKNCNENDEARYLWMCRHCKMNVNYNLTVSSNREAPKRLKCHLGEPVSFNSICYSGMETSCVLKRKEVNENILESGQIHERYRDRIEFNGKDNAVKLWECHEDDVDASFQLTCGLCREDFKLQIVTGKIVDPNPEEAWNGAKSYNNDILQRTLLLTLSNLIFICTLKIY